METLNRIPEMIASLSELPEKKIKDLTGEDKKNFSQIIRYLNNFYDRPELYTNLVNLIKKNFKKFIGKTKTPKRNINPNTVASDLIGHIEKIILSTHHVDFINTTIDDRRLFRILKIDRIKNPKILKKDKKKIKIEYPGKSNILYSARFRDKYRGIVTTENDKFLKNGVCCYITTRSGTVHVKILKSSLGISGAKDKQTVKEVVQYIVKRLKNVKKSLLRLENNKKTLYWVKENTVGPMIDLIENTCCIVEDSELRYINTNGQRYINPGRKRVLKLPVCFNPDTKTLKCIKIEGKSFVILGGSFDFYEHYRQHPILFEVLYLTKIYKICHQNKLYDLNVNIKTLPGAKLIENITLRRFVVDYYSLNTKGCYLVNVLFPLSPEVSVIWKNENLIPKLDFTETRESIEPIMMPIVSHEQEFKPITSVISLRVPPEYLDGSYPAGIDCKTANFLIDKIFDYTTHEIYSMILDYIYRLKGVIRGDLEYKTVKTIMIFTNFKLGFEVDLHKLYMYDHRDFIVVQDDDNTKFVKMQLSYEIPLDLKDEIKTNEKNPNIHTFHIYQNGRVTQTGPHQFLREQAYTKFRSYINSIKNDICMI
jgi:hypothetical protein